MKNNILSVILLFILSYYSNLYSQVTLTVRINSGNSATTCTDGFFGGAPDPQWRVNIAGQGWTTYPQAGICFSNSPNTQFNETYDCPSAYPNTIQVCFRAFEDDGGACIVSESCLEQICQNYPVPAPGTSATYTLSIASGSSTGSVNFTIQATGGFTLPGSTYDLICNAINLGTIPSGGSVGNDGLSNRGNYCATNTADPNPWGGSNNQGVWFTFTTSSTPATTMRFNAVSDPQGFGDGLDLQLALYRSSNGTCTGALNLVREEYEGLGTIWDEEMFVDCLQPNTTYYLLVDGENSFLTGSNGQQGFFGLEIFDNGIIQAGDLICDAQFLGTVPAGGSIGTPNLSQSNICASNTNDPTPGSWAPDKSVWYSFLTPPSGHVIIEAQSDLPFPIGDDAVDLQLALYSTNNNSCTGTLQLEGDDYDPIIFDEELDIRCLDPNRIYYLLVDGSTLNVDGIFDITIRDGGIPPAPNDSICNAIALGAPAPNGTVGLNNQNNYCADNLFEPIPSNWGNDQGVWYTFIAPPSGKVEIRLESAGFFSDRIDLQVAVYDAQNQGCNDPLTEVMSEYEGFGLLWDETAEVECLIPGRLYYILVDGQGSLINPDLQEGIFNIEVWADPRDPAGPNDLPCNAIPLGNPSAGPIGTTAGPQHGSQNNFCATAAGEPVPSGFTPTQTVWYTFVAPPSGAVRIQGFSDDQFSGVDPIYLSMAVWETPGCNGPWREVISGRDLIPIDIDLEVFCLKAGETYYLQVDGSPPALLLGWHEGYFDITINEIPPIPVAPNNLICDAIALGDPFAAPITVTNQNNLCADDIGDPQPSAFGTDQTVWYTFTTPPTGGPYAVDIDATTGLPWPFGSGSIDLQVAVFSSSNNTCTGTLTEIDSEYDIIFFDESVRVQCLLPNSTYFIMIDGSFIDPQGYFDLSVSPAPGVPIPTNDLICNFEDLGIVPIGGSLNNNVNYFNFCADTEPGEPSPFGIDQTVWFSFVAPQHTGLNATSEVTVRVESDPNNVGDAVDLQLAVYESSNNACNGNLSLVRDGSDDPLFSFDGEVNLTCLVPGRRYFVQVDGTILNIEGYFTIEVSDDGSGFHPPYDTICNAVSLGQVPNGGAINNGTVYTNLCATTQAGEPDPDAFNPNQSVWFTFETPASGNVTIDLISNFSDAINLQLAVYQAQNNSCTGPWLEIDSDYDGILFDESLTLECLVPNTLYYIQIDGEGAFGGDEGNFTIRIEDDGGTTIFPYNNDICNAYNFGLPAGSTTTLNNESNECANVQFGEPGVGGYAEHTVWYQFTAPPSGRVEISVVSTNLLTGVDPEVYVFSSSTNNCNGNLNQIESSNFPTALITENITAECLVPGNTYFIQIDGSGIVQEGTFNISIRDMEPLYGSGLPGDPEPPNNLCANAINIPVQSESCQNGAGSWSLYNYGQPTINYPSGGCGQNCGEIWYAFTMPSSGIALVEGNDDGVGSGFPFGDFSDLRVVAYTGSCGSLNQIACGTGGFTNDVGFEVAAPAGTTIYLQVFNNGGDDDNEDFELCVSQGCGADNCLNALAFPIQPNIPYCFNTAAANGENVSGGTPGYFECGEGDNPENSLYFSFVSDCNGSSVTLNVINAIASGGCLLGVVPDDGFNISFFQDGTPCDNNPDALVDCQNFNSCMVQPINWSFTYNNLQPNTPYIIQIDGGFNFLGGDNNGYIMIQTTTNPVVIPTTTPAGCNGFGTATATTIGGVAPFTFQWSNGSTDSIATNLPPGNYTVTVTSSGGAGCTDTASVTISSPINLSASILNSSNPLCANTCDGTATVGAIGGTVITGYTYLWDVAAGNQTTQTATGLCPGNYSVTVFDNSGCFDSTQVTIGNAPTAVTASLVSTVDAQCSGICNGQATVTASGGNILTDYNYLWANAVTTSTNTALCAGNYIVTVTDRIGCSDTVNLTINQPLSITASVANQNNVNCFSDSTGSFEILAINGALPYSYSIGNGFSAANTFTNLPSGYYNVTAQDVNGCFDTIGVLISEPALLLPQIVSTIDETCFGATDGQITVSASGGTGLYEFSIDGINFSSNNTFNALSASAYNVTVRDVNNCTASISAILNSPTQISVTLSSQTAASCGICDGTATILASGGTGPYSYLWTNGQTSQFANALCSGSNFVTVSDANSCTSVLAVNILNSTGFLVNNAVLPPSCNGNCDGQISLLAVGGTAPYTYLWNNSNTSAILTGLCDGSYSATITDANGCFTVENINVIQPQVLNTLAAQLQAVQCNGGSNGSAIATAIGGTLPYSYIWDNAETSQTASALNAGLHSVTVTDDNGCSVSATVNITEPSPFIVNIVNQTASDCGTTICNGTAQISVNGGQSPYTYLWSNGSTTAAPTNLCPNFNDVTVTDASGCTASSAVNIPSNSTLGLTVVSVINPSCFGNCNGSIAVTASGGNTTQPYIYSWSNGSTTSGISALCDGVYRVTVSDVDLCSNSTQITITEPSVLNATALVTSNYNGQNISCFGASNGIASVNVNGGISPYTYSWSNSASTQINSGLVTGSYNVTVTDNNNCTTLASVSLTEPTQTIVNATIISSYNGFPISCPNASDGIAEAQGSGGIAPYNYSWSNGQGSAVVTGLSVGIYTVSMTDNNGCVATSSITLSDPPTISISSNITNVSCFNGSNGSIDITVSGGAAPYTFVWSNGATTEDLINLTAPNYRVTIQDANNCTQLATYTLTQPSLIQVSISTTSVRCRFGIDGMASAQVSGGTAPYSYLWSNGSTTSTTSGLSAGTVSLTVTDANACTVSAVNLINQPSSLVIANILSTTNVACFGQSTGVIDADALGGTPNYTFQWSNGATTQDLSGVTVGTYTITATDQVGCSATASATLTSPDSLTASISILSNYNGAFISCNGASDGVASVTASGGVAPLTYLWSTNPIQNSSTISALAEGTYTVTVIDANGCSISRSVNFDDPFPLRATSSQRNISCFGSCDGQIIVTAIPGTGTIGINGYEYRIFGPGQSGTLFTSNNVFNNLCAGTYDVEVRDGNDCSIILNITLTEPTGLSVNLNSNSISCNGSSDGSISLVLSGGVNPYTYIWSNGQTTQNLSGLLAGIYTVTITDLNNCSITRTISVTEPSQISITVNAVSPTCNGAQNASASAVVVGGTSPYQYFWSNGAQFSSTLSLFAGAHGLTVTDANGCTSSSSFTISEPSAISATINGTSLNCTSGNNASATVLPNGGTSPYSFLWNNGQTTSTATGLSNGTYSVLVSDANGCQITVNYTISNPSPVVLSLQSFNNSTCFGLSNGSAVVNATGGSAPYTYSWPNGQSTNTATGLAAGAYLVTVNDNNGCSATLTVNITEPTAALITSISTTDVLCKGGSDGSASVNLNLGGTFPYTLVWSNGGTGQIINNLIAGTYTVTLTDGNVCQNISTVIVNEPASSLVGYINTSSALCNGSSTGQMTAVISGGTLTAGTDYTYLWSNGSSTENVSGVAAGSYTLTVTDANGCSLTLTSTVSESSNVSISIVNIADASCSNGANGFVLTSAAGGTGTLNYQWSNGQTTPFLTGLSAGLYTLTVTDTNGCFDTLNVQIGEGSAIQLNTDIRNISCFGASDGRIEVLSTGITQFFWSTGQVGNPLNNLGPGTYSLTVETNSGCRDTFIYRITEPELLSSNIDIVSSVSCFGSQNGQISLTVEGGTPSYSYIWSNGSTISTLNNLVAGSYAVTVTDNNGCTTVDQVQLNSPSELILDLIPFDVRCIGDQNGSIIVSGSGGSNLTAYEFSLDSIRWQRGDIFPNLTTGVYTVYIRDYNGCVNSDTVSISASDPFEITFIAPGDTTISYGDSITLSAMVSDSSSATVSWWNLYTNTVVVNGAYQTVQAPMNTIVYEFRAISPLGCEVDSSFRVMVNKQRSASAPAGFTPNGDGTNDSFFIQSDGKVSKIPVFRVFDRWGELVFEGVDILPNNPAQGWDGTFKNLPMNSGVYAWYAEIEYIDGYKEVIRGDVTLLR